MIFSFLREQTTNCSTCVGITRHAGRLRCTGLISYNRYFDLPGPMAPSADQYRLIRRSVMILWLDIFLSPAVDNDVFCNHYVPSRSNRIPQGFRYATHSFLCVIGQSCVLSILQPCLGLNVCIAVGRTVFCFVVLFDLDVLQFFMQYNYYFIG